MNERKRIKRLIIFIVTVIIISVSLTAIYTIFFDERNSTEVHVPLDLNISKNDIENAYHNEQLTVSNFQIVYYNELDKWQVQIIIKNISEENISVDDNYRFIFYDENKSILGTMEDKIYGFIEKNLNMGIAIVVDFDGSLIKGIEIKKI